MFAPMIRAASPVLANAGRAAAPVLREGAREGVQAIATVAVVYGAIAMVAITAFGTYHVGRVSARAASQATSATMSRVRDTFRRVRPVPAPQPVHEVGNVEVTDI
jgi:hypothetical protein